MFKTYSKKVSEIEHKWVLIDATGVPVGRVATLVATRLTGKYQPSFTPNMDSGDHVVVINAGQAILTGNKSETKKYYRYSGFPGGLKEKTAEQQAPEIVMELAVKGMLPKNKLHAQRMKRLHVFADANHAHAAQKPEPIATK
ncbi:50S ribosomal protein L13 [Candidatus Saccharibacteria bacterium]|jgi:large subunit ribosomal protein L13|nr:50S ribosomal protein L13 [Candidatus Saccharibacteria bacterium]